MQHQILMCPTAGLSRQASSGTTKLEQALAGPMHAAKNQPRRRHNRSRRHALRDSYRRTCSCRLPDLTIHHLRPNFSWSFKIHAVAPKTSFLSDARVGDSRIFGSELASTRLSDNSVFGMFH